MHIAATNIDNKLFVVGAHCCFDLALLTAKLGESPFNATTKGF